ncbi:MAG: ABC transporter permease [Candidatus Latescibacterota bacterium]|nr:MAG: ABC transporter permease [Candidatus Latescibacterota bacterium]
MNKKTVSKKSLVGENIRQAFDIIRTHRMRSGLLILGVAIGIMTILAMVTVMSGLVRKINKDLESANRPYLFVTRYDLFEAGVDEEEMLRRKKLEPEDAEALRNLCPALDRVCYLVSQGDIAFVLYREGEHTSPIELDGASHTFPEIFSLPIEHGRYFSEIEVSHRKRVVVLGYGPAQDLFSHENPIGKYVNIEKHRYQVIGTFADRKHFIGSISDNFAVIPHTSYRKDFQRDRDDPAIAANVKGGYTLKDAEEQIVNVMRVRRGLSPGEKSNFFVVTSTAFLEMVSKVTFAISGVLVVIASIGLLVGGIGVMNIMLISVAERTREIGIRRAIGANRRDIVQQFLMESATLTGIGGVIGTGLGTVFAILISRQIHFPFQFSFGWTITAVLFSVSVGVVFGIYPARRAAALDPVDALRYE